MGCDQSVPKEPRDESQEVRRSEASRAKKERRGNSSARHHRSGTTDPPSSARGRGPQAPPSAEGSNAKRSASRHHRSHSASVSAPRNAPADRNGADQQQERPSSKRSSSRRPQSARGPRPDPALFNVARPDGSALDGTAAVNDDHRRESIRREDRRRSSVGTSLPKRRRSSVSAGALAADNLAEATDSSTRRRPSVAEESLQPKQRRPSSSARRSNSVVAASASAAASAVAEAVTPFVALRQRVLATPRPEAAAEAMLLLTAEAAVALDVAMGERIAKDIIRVITDRDTGASLRQQMGPAGIAHVFAGVWLALHAAEAAGTPSIGVPTLRKGHVAVPRSLLYVLCLTAANSAHVRLPDSLKVLATTAPAATAPATATATAAAAAAGAPPSVPPASSPKPSAGDMDTDVGPFLRAFALYAARMLARAAPSSAAAGANTTNGSSDDILIPLQLASLPGAVFATAALTRALPAPEEVAADALIAIFVQSVDVTAIAAAIQAAKNARDDSAAIVMPTDAPSEMGDKTMEATETLGLSAGISASNVAG